MKGILKLIKREKIMACFFGIAIKKKLIIKKKMGSQAENILTVTLVRKEVKERR
jgi:hypothetical protein